MSPRTGLLLGALGALTACTTRSGPVPDLEVHGVGVVIRTDAPFARHPDLATRVETTLAAALEFWGGEWRALEGSTLTLDGAPAVACGGGTALGCWDGDLRITTQDPSAGTFACVEETVLVHEVGHAVLGDPLHEDPRWMDLGALAAALADRVGHTEDGDVPCEIHVSVWQHLLGRP
ncbi:MAG: hypothetical protein ACJ8AO_12310 [Gemmatimonadaceae bacterium]